MAFNQGTVWSVRAEGEPDLTPKDKADVPYLFSAEDVGNMLTPCRCCGHLNERLPDEVFPCVGCRAPVPALNITGIIWVRAGVVYRDPREPYTAGRAEKSMVTPPSSLPPGATGWDAYAGGTFIGSTAPDEPAIVKAQN